MIFYVVCVLGVFMLLILIYTYYKNKKCNAKDNFIAVEVKAPESGGEVAEGNIRLKVRISNKPFNCYCFFRKDLNILFLEMK